MGGPSSLKPPNSLHIFPMKPIPSSSPLSSMKLKTLLHTFIFYRIGRTFAKAKSLLLELLGDIQLVEFSILKKNKKQKKLFFGSFRLHYNWCTSHVMHANSHVYYDASWNTTTSLDDHDQQMDGSDELSRYLEWLEEKKSGVEECGGCNEIDELADLFIANCHEKFRLEKQESYRRFQEMMARSTL
ncbi:hypothetical protein ACS0TY_031666 [Phlomoides rotata]